MKNCPYCAEEIQDAAIKCRYCGSNLGVNRGWYRVREGKIIAGVCQGLAEIFGINVTALRLCVVILTFMGFGWGVLLYVILWIIMPYREGAEGRLRTRDGADYHGEQAADREDVHPP